MALFNADGIMSWTVMTTLTHRGKDGEVYRTCHAARPTNHHYDSLWFRIKLAFGVLVGKYDALEWVCESQYRVTKVTAATDQA
jgi:hypothetical protein